MLWSPAVAYRACYHCELLFDVDDATPGGGMPCPQCGQPLEAYQPPDEQALESELYGEEDDEAEAQQSTLLGESLAAPASASIVATHAFDGLSSGVREQLAARQASLSSEMGQARPTAQVPTPVPLSNAQAEALENKTRILDISGNQAAIEAMVASSQSSSISSMGSMASMPTLPAPEPMQPMTIDRSSPAPSPTASQAARFALASADDSGRHTRMLDLAGPPKAPTFSPVGTPPPMVRVDPPAMMEPIVVPVAPRATVPPPPEPRRLTPPVGTPRAPTPVAVQSAARAPAARAPAASGGRKTGLIIGVVAVVVLGGGAAAFFLTREKTVAPPPSETAAPGSPAPAGVTGDKLAAALADSQAELPRTKGGDPIMSDAPFLVGGPEGLSTSFGGVPGLPSLTLPDPQIERDASGEWVKPLKNMLTGNLGANPGRLVMALDYRTDARTAIRLAYSAHKAGFRQFGLGVDRGAEGRGSFAFTVQPAGVPVPTGGAMVISVGSISVKVDAQDAAGATLSDGVAVSHKEGTRPDLDGVVARIETILAANPGVKRALIYPNPEMTMEQLANVVERVSSHNGKSLFSEVSLAIR